MLSLIICRTVRKLHLFFIFQLINLQFKKYFRFCLAKIAKNGMLKCSYLLREIRTLRDEKTCLLYAQYFFCLKETNDTRLFIN